MAESQHEQGPLANGLCRIRYFTTSIRGAGIFLPSNKAYKRLSPSLSSDSIPPTPDTPNLGSSYLNIRAKEPKVYTPTSSASSKFSQSVGLGRARSPDFKPKSRPSLPRPESPLRKAQNAVTAVSGRPSIGAPKLSKSLIGSSRYAPSPTPAKFGTSIRGGPAGDSGKKVTNINKPTPRTPNNARSPSRTGSYLGPEAMFDEEPDSTPVIAAKTISTRNAQSHPKSDSSQENEIRQLRQMLEMRDKQLEKQTSDMEEMRTSIDELQTVTPKHVSAEIGRSRGSGINELDAPSLRALVREKNDKIATLTAEFDAHRSQFRSTIDSLERTSDETTRIYEQQVEDFKQEIGDRERQVEQLKQEVVELQDRGEDVDNVALQLKQLDQLVQELEEGLEDARRGEAEARGEVEFLRGEVERTRSELRREREKATAALKGAGASMENGFSPSGSSKEVEQRDDEIRGLKAIIHSLSRDAVSEMGSPSTGSRRVSKRHSNQANGHADNQILEERRAREKLERDVKDLESLVDRKTYREEELEHEIERLRRATAHVSVGSDGYLDKTAVPKDNRRPSLNERSSYDQHNRSPVDRQVPHLDNLAESDSHSTTMTDSSSLYCEMCEKFGHEIFTCPNINGEQTEGKETTVTSSVQKERNDNPEDWKNVTVSIQNKTRDYPAPSSPGRSPVMSPAVTPQAKMPNPMDRDPVAGKISGVIDMGEWCALCERDGHKLVDCPFEEMY